MRSSNRRPPRHRCACKRRKPEPSGLQGPSMHEAQTAVRPHRAFKTAGVQSCLFGSVNHGVVRGSHSCVQGDAFICGHLPRCRHSRSWSLKQWRFLSARHPMRNYEAFNRRSRTQPRHRHAGQLPAARPGCGFQARSSSACRLRGVTVRSRQEMPIDASGWLGRPDTGASTASPNVESPTG